MKILMLCLGNICRSPLAEGLLRSKLPTDFEIASAGTIAMHQGHGADNRMVETAKAQGIDLSLHRAQPLKYEHFSYYDRIYCMDKANRQDALKLARTQSDRDKVLLVLNHGAEVPDPYFGGQEGFENVYTLLDEALETLAQTLVAQKK